MSYSIEARTYSKEISLRGVALEHKSHLVKWVVVCPDKRKRDLGVKSLSVLNKTLLCKWSRCFAIERGAFWNRVIHGKYGETRGGGQLRR